MAAACAPPEQRAAEHLARAEAYRSEGKRREALIELQSALKLDPGSAEVNERLGELLAETGAAQAASFHFGEAYRLDPQRLEAGLRPVLLLWHSAPGRAAAILESIEAQHPDAPALHRTRAALALAGGDADAALEAARRAVALGPDAAESWLSLGLAHRAQLRALRLRGAEPDAARFREAIAAFERAESLSGGDVRARYERARVYAVWPGHREQALAGYRGALALARERGDAAQHQAAALALDDYARATGDLGLRAEALRELVAVDPSRIQAWEQLAHSARQLEGPEAEDAVYRELLARQPESAAAHIAYTSHLVRTRRGLEAIAHLERVLPDALDEPELWEQRMRLELAEGLREEARASVARLRERHPKHPLTQRSAARVAIADGRYAEALELLHAAAGGEEPDAELAQLEALAALGLGDVDQALEAIERAIAGAAGFPLAARRLEASIRQRAQQWQASLDALAELERQGVRLTSAERVMRASALYQLGRPDDGRRELDALLAQPVVPPAAALEFSRREAGAHPEDARRQLARALRDAPGSAALLVALTRLDVQGGESDRALARLEAAVESSLADPRLLLLRAELLLRRGDLPRAEADALRALERDPRLPGATELLFDIYAARGGPAQALRAYEEADSVGVLHAGGRSLLARLAASQGRRREAERIYEAVLASDPHLASARRGLAALLAEDGRELERALALATEARRAEPDVPDSPGTVGFVELRRGRPAEALAALEAAIELAEAARGEAPARFHYHRALALSALARHEEAADALERALALEPDFPEADAVRRALEQARRARADDPS